MLAQVCLAALQPDLIILDEFQRFGHLLKNDEETSELAREFPALPFSRDEQRLHDLRRSLAIYRMVFGQSRQEDLITYLLKSIPDTEREAIVAELQINLCPFVINKNVQITCMAAE